MSVSIIAIKEFSDNVASKRFLILFLLLSILSILSAFTVSNRFYGGNLKSFSDLLTTGSLSLIYLIGVVGPLIGISLGFDCISREIESGSLMLLLSCPVHRDEILNGKILGGLLTIILALGTSITLLIGFIMIQIGIAPNFNEILRLIIFFLASIIYILCYMSLSILTSIIFRRSSISLLVSMCIWIFFTFMINMVASSLASFLPEVDVEGRIKVLTYTLMTSPTFHFYALSRVIINPQFVIDPFGIFPRRSFSKELSLIESLNLATPNMFILIVLLMIFISISYIKFLREEIR